MGGREGGRDEWVGEVTRLLERVDPDVVFGLDPRHGSTCNPTHRAASLVLIEAVGRLPEAERPRVLFENTISVPEHMSAEMLAATATGAMFPWPDSGDGLFYDAGRTLPDGRRAVELQLESLRAHASQFPDLPDDVTLDAEPSRLRIPLVERSDLDPETDFCSPIDLSFYATADVTLDRIGKRIGALAERADFAVRLVARSETILDLGDVDARSHRREHVDPGHGVRLSVGAAGEAEAAVALESAVRLLRRHTDVVDEVEAAE